MKLSNYLVTGLVVVTVALSVIEMWSSGQRPLAGAVLVLGGGFAAWFTRRMLRRGKHVDWTEAARQLAPGHAVVLWKPGCIYCERLQRQLDDDERITWVNVHADEEANRQVRGLNEGNEYTPTVILGDRVLRNPSADQVREALAGRQPET